MEKYAKNENLNKIKRKERRKRKTHEVKPHSQTHTHILAYLSKKSSPIEMGFIIICKTWKCKCEFQLKLMTSKFYSIE